MKKVICILILLSLNLVQSQITTSLTVTESPTFEDEIYTDNTLAIHNTSTGLLGMIRSYKNKYLLTAFDKQLNKKFSKIIEIDKDESFESYVGYGDEIKYITVLAPSKGERTFYCGTYNIEKETHSKKELFKADAETGGLLTGRNKRGTNIATSPNRKYIAIATDNIKKNLNSYKIHVFDTESMHLVFEKSYQEDVDNYFEPNDLFVDDDANVYALGKLFISGKSEKKGGDANYDFVLNKISKEDSQNLKISIGNDLHISSLAINYYENKLNLVGFYSNDRAGKIKGGCHFQISTSNLTILSNKNSVLPKDVYTDLYGAETAERYDKNKKELNSFYVDYVYTDTKGNIFLIAEEFYISQSTVSTGPKGVPFRTTTYHYDDILILKFDKNGEIIWGRSIFKKYEVPSYKAFLKDDKLHVLLNAEKDLNEKSDGRIKISKGWGKSSALYDFNYSADGKVDYNKIQDNKGNNYYIPYYGTYNNGIFIMMSNSLKINQFMLLN
jgi:hypothetical protein